jgi:O-antigen/teichoic acid export membrane protein
MAPVSWIGSALLVRQVGGFEQLAMFSAADRFRFVLIFIPLAVSRIALPALARHRSANNRDAYRDTVRWNLGFSMLVTIPPALLCVLLAPWLMSLFGESFRPGWPVMAVLAASTVPALLNTQLGAVLLSHGRAWPRAGVDALLAAAFLCGIWFAVPRWNAMGLAVAFFASYSFASLVLWLLLQRTHAEFDRQTL